MKKFFFLAVFFVVACTAFSQNKSEQEVASAVESLKQAIVDGDSAKLMSLTDPKLTYGHSSGLIEDQQVFVSNLASGRSDFQNMDLTEQKVTVIGDVAWVRHQLSATIVNNGGAPTPTKLSVLLVWRKANKQWRLIARQAVKVIS